MTTTVGDANAASKPTDDAIVHASRQALAMLRREFPQLEASHDELVSEARAYALGLPDADTYEARVTKKAAFLALDLIRKDARLRAPVRSTAERPLTEVALKAAVLEECRARVLRAMGPQQGGAFLAELAAPSNNREMVALENKRAKDARAVLRALRGASDEVLQLVNIKAMEQFAHLHGLTFREFARLQGYLYCDASGHYREFGGLAGTNGERALVSLLLGHWPKLRVGEMTAAEVIESEADGMAKAGPQPQRPTPARSTPEK